LRKAAIDGFVKDVKQFYEIQTTEAVLLVSDSLANPAKWDDNVRRSMTSTVLSIIYGYPTITDTTEKNDLVDQINDFSHRLTSAALPGAHLVEFFRWMRYIPSR
jgi:hypothetical protein